MRFDNYYLESSLYTDGRVDRTVAMLVASGHTYEQDGALWLRTTDYGDDKDRVMRKSDGGYTYFVPDVAYHVTKFERGFAKVINVQGSDHHGTVARVRAGLQAVDMGIPPGYPDYVLHKMVTVMRGGEEVKISKRAGSYVTLRDLIDEVGRDAVRFFLVSRKADSRVRVRHRPRPLAVRGEPRLLRAVRARARRIACCGRRGVDYAARGARLRRRRPVAAHQRVRGGAAAPARRLSRRDCRRGARTSRRTSSRSISRAWPGNSTVTIMPSAFWSTIRSLRRARLALVVATGQVLRNGLTVLGIGAPEQM